MSLNVPTMTSSDDPVAARFESVVHAFGHVPGVTFGPPGSRRFGRSALKVHDKIFAMIDARGNFVVKLPRARVEALVIGGVGQRLEAGQGRPMKEWLEVHSGSAEEWLQLAREALDFVGS